MLIAKFPQSAVYAVRPDASAAPEPLPPIVSRVDIAALPWWINTTVTVTIALLGHPMLALEIEACNGEPGGSFHQVLDVAVQVSGPAHAAEVIAHAVKVARAIPDAFERHRVLGIVAGAIAARDPTDPEAIAQAVDLALSVPIPEEAPDARWTGREHQWALRELAEGIAEAGPADPAVIASATSLADTINDDTERRRALDTIAWHVFLSDPSNIEAADRVIRDNDERSHRRPEIARQIARGDPTNPAAIARAVELANTGQDWHRGWVLADIVEQALMPDPTNPETIDAAIALSRTIPDGWHRSLALARVSEQISTVDPARASSLLEEAIRLARSIDDPDERSAALSDIAKLIAGSDPTNPDTVRLATDLADEIPQDGDRRSTMLTVATAVALSDPMNPAALEWSISLIDSIAERDTIAQLILETARSTATADPTRSKALIARAVETVKGEQDDEERRDALIGLAEGLATISAPLAAELLGRALEIAIAPEATPHP